MPGRERLAPELGVSRKTVELALGLLEKDGLLVPQGGGRRRAIRLPEGGAAGHSLRVAILVGEAADRRLDYMVDLQHELADAGHRAIFADTAMDELGMDVGRIARMVRATGADAWVVVAGSREIVEWFIGQEVPAFALFGRRGGLPIAGVGPDKPSAMAAVARRLIALGHRRIVLLARTRRRLPVPGLPEQTFLDELARHGIGTGPYNLPDWRESIDGFHGCLEGLFRHTPPTALIIDEGPFFMAALQFCGCRGIRVPEDVSLICTDSDPSFAWCKPSITRIRWDPRPVVSRVVRWASNLSRGKEDLRQSFTRAEFVEGGTIGPVVSGKPNHP
jgi:DNA-binding LacI/PurR family transcriptional regulator